MGKVINMPEVIRPDTDHTRWEFSLDPDRNEKPYISIKCGVAYGFNGWTVYVFCSSYDEMIQCRTQALEQLKNQIHITGLVQK